MKLHTITAAFHLQKRRFTGPEQEWAPEVELTEPDSAASTDIMLKVKRAERRRRDGERARGGRVNVRPALMNKKTPSRTQVSPNQPEPPRFCYINNKNPTTAILRKIQ